MAKAARRELPTLTVPEAPKPAEPPTPTPPPAQALELPVKTEVFLGRALFEGDSKANALATREAVQNGEIETLDVRLRQIELVHAREEGARAERAEHRALRAEQRAEDADKRAQDAEARAQRMEAQSTAADNRSKTSFKMALIALALTICKDVLPPLWKHVIRPLLLQ